MSVTNQKKWVSIPKFASEMKCDTSLVYQSIKDQKILYTIGTDGRMLIDINSQKAAFLNNHPRAVQRILLNKAKRADAEERKVKKKNLVMDAAAAVGSSPESGGNDDVQYVASGIAVSKARKEKALAKKAELDAAEREGKLVDLSEMLMLFKTVAIETRKAILSIPDRLAPVLAGERDQHKCHRMMTEELTYALRTLAQDLRELQKDNHKDVELEDFVEEEPSQNENE